jgi:hypothetical protein
LGDGVKRQEHGLLLSFYTVPLFLFIQGGTMNYRNLRGLLAAVIIQAAKDARLSRYQDEVESFISSAAFDWMWEELKDDVIGLPYTNIARRMLADGLDIKRSPYH